MEYTEPAPLEPLKRVDGRNAERHPRIAPWVHSPVEPSRLARRDRRERRHVVVAADHAIERHDVGRRKGVRERDKIAVDEARPGRVSAALRLLPRHRYVSRRRVDVNRALYSAVEQLVLDDSDAAADIEQQRAANVKRVDRSA